MQFNQIHSVFMLSLFNDGGQSVAVFKRPDSRQPDQWPWKQPLSLVFVLDPLELAQR